MKKDGPVGELKDKLRSLGKKLDHVGDLMESEAKLQSQLLDPLEAIQGAYRTRYLQAFDKVTGKCEASPHRDRQSAGVPPVQGHRRACQDRRPGERQRSDAQRTMWLATRTGLFQSSLDRNAVERGLKDRPQPEGCSLHVDEADATRGRCGRGAWRKPRPRSQSALVNMASLLRQPALRSLLEQGKQEKFIADVLAAANDEKLADILAECVPDRSRQCQAAGEVPEDRSSSR